MTILISICCLIAFLAGGIPFGYLVGKLVLRDDIRRHGSGNIGATNVTRILGWKWGGLVLVLDALKGLLPTLAAGLLLKASGAQDVLPGEIATGISAILGHMYPVWLKLRGGKGVATALGVVLIVAPLASAVALVMFVLVAVSTRIVALASMLASVTFAATQLAVLRGNALVWPYWPLTIFAVLMPALIIWRHRSNIVRLIRGEEKSLRTVVTSGEGHPVTEHFDPTK